MLYTEELAASRTCGAIALVETLRRHGVERTVGQVWSQVAMPDPFGTCSARSYRLAGYAQRCGLNAVTLRCRPAGYWDALRFGCRSGISVIVNHQATAARHEGHFSILESVNEESVVLTDPFRGPGQEICREQMQELWQSNVETVGHILIAISDRADVDGDTSSPAPLMCPGCGTPVSLTPARVFVKELWQRDGLWQQFYCNTCDATFRPQTRD